MTRKIQLTTRQLNDLMADLAALPAKVIGSHLSDEALFGYTMGTLDASTMQQVDLHLASCSVCAAEAERLVDASQVWFGEAGERRLATLREQVLGKEPSDQPSLSERLNKWLQDAMADWQATFSAQALGANTAEGEQLALAADTPEKESRTIWEPELEDELLRIEAELDSEGDLTFWIDSEEIELRDKRFRLRWQELEREFVLQEVSATEVGAEVLILAHERPADWKNFTLEVM